MSGKSHKRGNTTKTQSSTSQSQPSFGSNSQNASNLQGSLFDQLESEEQMKAEDRLLKDLNAQKGIFDDDEDGMIDAVQEFSTLFGIIQDPHAQLPRVQYFLEGELDKPDYDAAMQTLQLGRKRTIQQKVMSHKELGWFGGVELSGADMLQELRDATTAERAQFAEDGASVGLLMSALDVDQRREAVGLLKTASEFEGEHVNADTAGDALSLNQESPGASLFERLDDRGKALADNNLIADLNAQTGWVDDDEDGMMQAVTEFIELWGAVASPRKHLPKSTEFLQGQLGAADFRMTVQNMQTGNARTLAQKVGACVYLDWKNSEQRDGATMLEELRKASPEERAAFAADASSMALLNTNLGGAEFKEAMSILGTSDTYGAEHTGRAEDPGMISSFIETVSDFDMDWEELGEQITSVPGQLVDLKDKALFGAEGIVLGLGIGLTEASFMLGNLAWGDMTGDVEINTVDEKTKDIPPYHIIMEQLAHRYAYYPAQDPKHLGYEVKQVIFNAETDFQVVWFSPTKDARPIAKNEPARDVVAFRGTDKIPGWLDDSNTEGVGAFQWAMSEADILGMLSAASQGGPADVCGHSLGGALAQRAAAVYGGLVADIVTFQSPGLNAEEFENFDPDKHKSNHYRRQGDWVPAAGEQWSPGEVTTLGHVGWNVGMAHTEYPLAEINAIRGLAGNEDYIPGLEEEYRAPMIDSVVVEDVNDQNYIDQGWNMVSEWRRKSAGNVISADKASSARAWKEARSVIVAEAGQTDTDELTAKVHAMLAESTKDHPDHTETLQIQATKLIQQFDIAPPVA